MFPKLDEQQLEKYNKWLENKDLTKYGGAIAGRFTWMFTPTTIGLIVKVKDNLDNNEIDLTDYEMW